ncbi:hypothetical protein [Reinekea sp. G2M2-21]|uniref:hypothetical protein n=1 Tax=Reinekea sp. G2M2-21 TaxID=2788942 RepID=UPI0018ABBFC2|nr:hypothetical protein [Reinekea sp. G2M2-21]
MRDNLSKKEVLNELSEAKKVISGSELSSVWDDVQVEPILWTQNQYNFDEEFWVIAVVQNYCLYFNFVEEGWGWGKFVTKGTISSYQWEQEEIHEAFLWRYKELELES